MTRQSHLSVNYDNFISSVGVEIWSFRVVLSFMRRIFFNAMRSGDKAKLKTSGGRSLFIF